MTGDETTTLLNETQRQRIEALQAARGVMSGAPFSTPNVMDLHTIAQYILDGRDPWAIEIEDDDNTPLTDEELAVERDRLGHLPDAGCDTDGCEHETEKEATT